MAFTLLAGLGYILVIARDHIVPTHFGFDSQKIQSIAQGGAYGDLSYDAVGTFYRIAGLNDSPIIAGILGFSLYIILLFLILKHSKTVLNRYSLIPFAIAMVVGAVYLGEYSKDVFILPIVFMIVSSGCNRGWDLCLVSLIILYGFNFRSYWILVAVAYLFFIFLSRRVTFLMSLTLFMPVVVAALSLAIVLIMGVPADNFRSEANLHRAGSENATTMIRPFVEFVEPLGGIVNNVLTLLFLMFPIPLALTSGVFYTLLAMGLAFLWVALLSSLKKLGQKPLEGDAVMNARIMRSVSLVLALVCVQALFEPDYGSALRHITPLLPLIFLVTSHAASLSLPFDRPKPARV